MDSCSILCRNLLDLFSVSSKNTIGSPVKSSGPSCLEPVFPLLFPFAVVIVSPPVLNMTDSEHAVFSHGGYRVGKASEIDADAIVGLADQDSAGDVPADVHQGIGDAIAP